MDEKKMSKKFSYMIGTLLVIIAAILLVSRSGNLKNMFALTKSPEKYVSYVLQNGMDSLNEAIGVQYEAKQKNFAENGQLYRVQEISVFAEAKALLKTYLDVNLKATELDGTMFYVEEADRASLTGMFGYGEEEYPIEYEKRAEVFSLNALLEADVLSVKQLKKLLQEYEELILDTLERQFTSKETQSVIRFEKEKVLHEVSGCSDMERLLELYLCEEDMVTLTQVLCDRMLKDNKLKEVYEAASMTDTAYVDFVEKLRQKLQEAACPVELSFYVNDRGKISSVSVVMDEQQNEFGFGYIVSGSYIGIETTVKWQGEELLNIYGTVGLSGELVGGTIQGTVKVKEEMQKFKVKLLDFCVMDVVNGRVIGEVLVDLTEGPIEDAGASLSLCASNAYQEILLSVIYGGADQLNVKIMIQDTE